MPPRDVHYCPKCESKSTYPSNSIFRTSLNLVKTLIHETSKL